MCGEYLALEGYGSATMPAIDQEEKEPTSWPWGYRFGCRIGSSSGTKSVPDLSI